MDLPNQKVSDLYNLLRLKCSEMKYNGSGMFFLSLIPNVKRCGFTRCLICEARKNFAPRLNMQVNIYFTP